MNLGRVGGWSSWVQFQLQKKWWLQARLENLDQVTLGNTQTKSSLLIGFVPTEYSALRLQYDHSEVPSALEAEQRITLQLNVSMGAHPAHSY